MSGGRQADRWCVAAEETSILTLEVPVIVLLGQRSLKVADVLVWGPGTILELGKSADEPLELFVNNKALARGVAVKVGENFGLRLTGVGAVVPAAPAESAESDAALDAMAEQMVAGQA